MLALEGDVALVDDLLPILSRTAHANLLAVGNEHGEDCDTWFAHAATGRRRDPGGAPAEEIERSLAVGAGLVQPDLLWAVGSAWRALYPALVERLGDGGLRVTDWPGFHLLAAEMERVAFGPSPLNAAKLLALVESGVVDLSRVADGEPDELDVLVDAVLPGPGVVPGGSALIDGLIADGHVRIAPGRRGLDVAADGSCRASDGSPSCGLAAIGRPTEDSVIGNDTLSRTLHPLSDRWARRVVKRPVLRARREPAA
jgi:diaminopimelate decarboxylase